MKQFAAALLFLFAVAHLSGQPPSKVSAARVALDNSLNARLHPVPVSAVRISNGFWGTRARAIAEKTLPLLRQQLEERGVIDNFLRAANRKNVPRRGRGSSDCDLYRWIEAASWFVAAPGTSPAVSERLQAELNSLVPLVAAAQDPSGYLNTAYTSDRAHLRFTDLLHSREDTCLARLIAAAIAHFRATGSRDLLNVAQRFADYMVTNFGPSARPYLAADPELVSAFVELYRTAGVSKYLDFARYLLSGGELDRLHLKESEIRSSNMGRPFTSRTEFDGQAVGALESISGAVDFFAESGDPDYKRAIDVVWSDLTGRHLSITGGVGLRAGDQVGAPYDIKGGVIAAETPVAIANVDANYRLLALTGDAKYGDVLERALYNDVSAGLSQNGLPTCGKGAQFLTAERLKTFYYETESCPPALPSLVASLGSAMYATSLDGVYVNLFNESELDWHLEDGTPLRLVQSTNYPWEGEVRFTVQPAKPIQFTVYLRWPEWAPTVDVSVNNASVTGDFRPGTFIAITRKWQPGDSVVLNFPLQPSLYRAPTRVTDLYDRAVITRGPLVYTVQQSDQGGLPAWGAFLRVPLASTVEFRRDLLGGITVLKCSGFALDRTSGPSSLYIPWREPARRPSTLVLAPYFTIGSRDPEAAATWLPVVRQPDTPPAPLNTRPGTGNR